MAIASNSRMTNLTGRKWWFQPRIGKGGPCGYDIGDGVFCDNPMMQPIPAALVADFSQATLEPQGSNTAGVTATFTRASTATVTDCRGVIKTVAENVPRFQGACYDTGVASLVRQDATRSAMGADLSGTDKWVGIAAGADGKLYCAPRNSPDILIIDPIAGTAIRSNMGADLSGIDKWVGIAAGADGKLYCAPRNSPDILIIDPIAGTATRSAMGADLSSNNKWVGIAAGADGKLYCGPLDATDILIIDPIAGTATRSNMGADLSGGSKWQGIAAGADGKLYCASNNSFDILIIDPIAGTATRSAMGADLSGGAKWQGIAAGADGKLYCAPFNSFDILIIDPIAGTATRSAMGADLSEVAKWQGVAAGADGKLYCAPNNSADILIIDPIAGTATRSAMGADLSEGVKWGRIAAGVDGKLYCAPRNAIDILVIDPTERTVNQSTVAYLNEPAATNTAVQSENLTTGWSASVNAIIVDHETISFEGNTSQRIFAPVGAAVVGQETVGSVYLKGVPGNKVIVSLYTSEEDGAWDDYSVVFTLTDKYVRHEIKRTWASTGNRTMFIGTHPDNPVQVINATYIQHEVGSNPTSYIPTAGAEATRAEDRLVYNNVVANGEFTIGIDFTAISNWQDAADNSIRLYGSDDSRGTDYEIRTASGGSVESWTYGFYSNGSSSRYPSSLATPGARLTQVFSVGASDSKTYALGEQKFSIATTMELDHSNTNDWGIGNWVGSQTTPLLIHSASIYPQALTDEQFKWLSIPGNVPPVA